ncbi:MAG: DegT/DnrJ/EryC1/StrS family aminotransferase [Clostridiales bacterium]|nr:DegT/DnrJ/EryC1/StrS family aminotransferase [Clostridiales bacterium]
MTRGFNEDMRMGLEKFSSTDVKEIFGRIPEKRVGEQDIKYVWEVLNAGFGNSDRSGIIGRFEEAFARKFGVDYAISHCNGTATMHSCLLAAGIGPGDEVIVPALTMASTALVAIYCYAVPVFADIDPATFTISVEDVKRKITPFTKAIIPVSIYGLSPDMDPIMELAKEYDLTVIEDNAQCYLGYYKGRLVGTLGHAASFSFQGSKHMTTSGEGGIVICNDPELAFKIRKAGLLGYSSISAKPGSVCIPRDIRQNWEFKRHDGFGYNFRLASICAALGLGQLERLEDLVAARQAVARLYEEVVSKCKWLTAQYVPEGYVNSWWTYACRLDEDIAGINWRTFRKKFIEFGGDGLYSAWYPVHLEPVFRDMNFYGDPLRAPHYHPLYKGRVKSYQPGDCPVLERIQPTLMQLKTGYSNPNEPVEQAEALWKTIRYFEQAGS